MKLTKYYLLLLLLILGNACSEGDNRETRVGESQSGKEKREHNSGLKFSKKEASQYIKQWVDSTELKTNLPQIREKQVAEDLFAFYSERNFTPAWSKGTALNLVSTIQSLHKEGLNPASYPLDTIEVLLQQAQRRDDAKNGAKLDVLLSATYLKVADIIATGKVKPGNYYKSWHINPISPDTLYTHLQQAIAEGNINASLDYFRPRFDQYQKLQQYIETYTKIISNGGWPKVETGAELKPGDSSQRVATIRERLHISGDIDTPPAQWTKPAVYDKAFVAAVNSFQKRMGLPVQPTITDNMIEALNISAEMRLKQLMLNMDRIRWFSSGDMPDTYVLVNIPEYRLRVVDGGEEIKTMKVVVGKRMNSTPIFSDKIEYAIFSPYWNVPNSIATEEIWPKARNNPGYLASRHFEILTGWGNDAKVISPYEVDWDNLSSYRIRQKPGPWNALGRVKFMFPNDFAIYLHDTPSDHLFQENHRAFSHGCIRVEDPAWFADWLFPQFNRQDVRRKMNDGKREVISLENDIPVYIFYLTSFVDQQGRLNFREDLYQLDKKLTKVFDLI